jgi:predicted kinase
MENLEEKLKSQLNELDKVIIDANRLRREIVSDLQEICPHNEYQIIRQDWLDSFILKRFCTNCNKELEFRGL